MLEKLEMEDSRNSDGFNRRRSKRRRPSNKSGFAGDSSRSFTEEKLTTEKPKNRRRRSKTRKTSIGELKSDSEKTKKPSRMPHKQSVRKPKEDNS